jgi:hypothetical protein
MSAKESKDIISSGLFDLYQRTFWADKPIPLKVVNTYCSGVYYFELTICQQDQKGRNQCVGIGVVEETFDPKMYVFFQI